MLRPARDCAAKSRVLRDGPHRRDAEVGDDSLASRPVTSLFSASVRRALVAGTSLAFAATALVALAPSSTPNRVIDAEFASTETNNQVLVMGNATYHGQPTDGRQVGIAPTKSGNGYWTVNRRGGVFTFGDAQFHGSAGNIAIDSSIADIAATPSGNGYWLVSQNGGVFSFGDAQFWGSTGGLRLNQPVLAIEPTPTGGGYWLIARDGGIFSFGDAQFYGSTGAMRLNAPVVGMTSTPTGAGYWLVAEDGGIFSFGDAEFYGSTGAMTLNQPVVDMARSPSGHGYWLAARDGGVFTFGDAIFRGSGTGYAHVPVNRIVATTDGGGYWMLASPPAPAVSPRVHNAPGVPANSSTGRRAVYSNSMQRVWIIEEDTGEDIVVDTYAVSGKRGVPAPGVYSVQRRLNPGYSTESNVSLPYFVGFAWGTDTDIGFHAIPIDRNGNEIQSESELGQFRSAGCVRQARSDALIMWNFAHTGTKVVVLA